MQGSIFTAFSDMIIDNFGMEQWNGLIEKAEPISKGIYTSGEQYQDSELIDRVILLSKKTGVAPEVLVQEFGRYLFIKLYNSSLADVSKITRLRDFLLVIDKVIHVEIKRLHPYAYLPSFEYGEGGSNQLIMYYNSTRKLCHVGVGLILGAADRFNEKIEMDHSECMHRGADRCKLVITFKV